MTVSSERPKWPHAWILYVASLAPCLAIAYAFHLGPSPRKCLEELRTSDDATARSLVAKLPNEALPLLVEEIERSHPYRELFIRHLGKLRHTPAAGVLSELSRNADAPEEVRVEALHALERIDASTAVQTARSLEDVPNAVRAEAKRILQHSDRS